MTRRACKPTHQQCRSDHRPHECVHTWEDCAWPDGADECPHWHHEPDITFTITPDMAEAAAVLGASGAELLGHAINSALNTGAADPEPGKDDPR